MEIRIIKTIEKEESKIKRLLEKQIFEFVLETSKQEEFEEVLVNLKYLQ